LREQAEKHPERVFTTLHHLMDLDHLEAAYRRTRKDAAVGVDEVTAEEYEADLLGNLADLRRRVHEGRYRAQPVRRAWIEEEGKRRPLGIPALEDKILERAVVMVLECIYEAGFYPSSYGFRPGRSAHQALNALR
jgi:RNA-directed DNA polymerase